MPIVIVVIFHLRTKTHFFNSRSFQDILPANFWYRVFLFLTFYLTPQLKCTRYVISILLYYLYQICSGLVYNELLTPIYNWTCIVCINLKSWNTYVPVVQLCFLFSWEILKGNIQRKITLLEKGIKSIKMSGRSEADKSLSHMLPPFHSPNTTS